STRKMKTGPQGPVEVSGSPAILLDFGFAEFDVLARDRVVLLLDQLVGHGARVLLGDVVEAGVGRGHELDLDGDRFGHVLEPYENRDRRRPNRLGVGGNLAANAPKSRFSGRMGP